MTPRRPRRPAGSHARCDWCGRTYRDTDGCDPDLLPTVAVWGAESRWTEVDEWPDEYLDDDGQPPEPLDRCPICLAALDHPHHPGCSQAWCWSCEDQALTCRHLADLEVGGR